DIATLDARIAATVTTWRSRNIARPGRERDKNRIKTVDDVLLAANHHAVSAFEAPDPAARSDVNVMQAAPLERLSTADIVFPEGVAAIDDDIARCEQHAKLVDGAFRDLAGRQHQPDRARLAELAHELFEPASPCGPFVGQYPDGLRLPVKYDCVVSVLHQPANDVAAHAPQSNDSDLHRASSFERAFDSGAQYRQHSIRIPFEMDAHRAPTALRKHFEVAARLRGLDHTEACCMARNREICRLVSRNLKKDAAIRASLVCLAG